MSRNFDYPPASSSRPLDIGSMPARFHNIRQTLQRERERDRVAWDHAAAERMRDHRDMPPVTRSASHRRPSGPRRQQPPFRSGRSLSGVQYDVPSSLGRRQRAASREAYPVSRARRGITSREQYANLHPHLERHPASTSERLDHINSSLNDLLDPSSFHRGSFSSIDTYLTPHTPPHDDEDRQRMKRRKLDHHNPYQESANIKYGHYGQVESGQLKMKMIECDGGQLQENNNPSLHRPENVLRTDKSVYCTQRPQCNLLLQHADDTTFSLEKIIIKSPDKGFTAPVQEGLIFVAMSSRGLLESASQYTIQYQPPSPRYVPRQPARVRDPRSRNQDEGRGLTLLEAINDEQTWDTYQRTHDRSHSSDGGVPLTPRYQDENEEDWRWRQRAHHAGTHEGTWATADDILSGRVDRATVQPSNQALHQHTESRSQLLQLSPQDFRAPTPPPPPQICVTTSTDDPTLSLPEEDTEPTSPAILADRVVRESRMRSPTHEDDEWFPDATIGYPPYSGSEDTFEILPPLERTRPNNETYSRHHAAPMWRDRGYGPGSQRFEHDARHRYGCYRRSRPSNISLRPSSPSSHRRDLMSLEGGVVEPTARFFIPGDKNAIAVKFDPPISGRWVVVRLFSPEGGMGGNVDVQSISCWGWGGQRYFPAVEVV